MSKVAMLMLGTLIVAAPSFAATSPPTRCSQTKLKAAARVARTYTRCSVDAALKHQGFVSPDCTSHALDPLADRFERIEAAGGCATLYDHAEIRAIVEQAVNGAGAFVDFTVGTERCTSLKMRAVGAKLHAILAAHAAAVRNGDAERLARAVARAESRFADRFAAAESLGPCANAAATATAVEDQLDHPITQVRGKLAPLCGDDVRAGSEACDGADSYCSGHCLPDCTCSQVVCGDDVREGSEACDGTDDAACPGACQPNCRCPGTCGDGAVNNFEQCDGAASQACGPSGMCQAPGLLGECQCCSTGYCSGGFPNVCCGESVRCVRNAQSPVGVCTPYGCTQASDCGIGGYNCENNNCCAQPTRSCINIGCCAGSTCTWASGVPLCCIPSGSSCAAPAPEGICCSGSCNAGTGLCN